MMMLQRGGVTKGNYKRSGVTKLFICSKRSVSYVPDLRAIIGQENVLTRHENDDISCFTTDWTKSFHGGTVLAFPADTEQVSAIMKYCHQHGIQVVPQSGNTSLSGGAIPVKNELIINMKRMNRILQINQAEAVLVAESGCILENLSDEVNKYNMLVPLDLGAKGSCMIGGNVATNAGGLRVYKYGSLHHNVLGLEVVLADGTILNMLRTLRKDNSGFPLKHLFIGSEGSLGIITKVAMQLAQAPLSTRVALLKVASFENISELLMRVRADFGPSVSAIEYIDTPSLRVLAETMPHIFEEFTQFIECDQNHYYVLIEFSSSLPETEV